MSRTPCVEDESIQKRVNDPKGTQKIVNDSYQSLRQMSPDFKKNILHQAYLSVIEKLKAVYDHPPSKWMMFLGRDDDIVEKIKPFVTAAVASCIDLERKSEQLVSGWEIDQSNIDDLKILLESMLVLRGRNFLKHNRVKAGQGAKQDLMMQRVLSDEFNMDFERLGHLLTPLINQLIDKMQHFLEYKVEMITLVVAKERNDTAYRPDFDQLTSYASVQENVQDQGVKEKEGFAQESLTDTEYPSSHLFTPRSSTGTDYSSSHLFTPRSSFDEGDEGEEKMLIVFAEGELARAP